MIFAYITVETADGGFALERPIHIMFYRPCTSLTFTTENPKVSVDGTCQLEWDIKPGDNQAAPAQFSSSDESIATVDADGKVTGVSEGKATITATSYKLYKKPVTATTELKVLRPMVNLISREYVLALLQSPYFIDEATFKGTANQQRIISGYVENKLFPLPPVEEQKRIVRKIQLLNELII